MLDVQAVEQRVQRAGVALDGRGGCSGLRCARLARRVDTDGPRHPDHSDDREDREEEERSQAEGPAHRGGSAARAS